MKYLKQPFADAGGTDHRGAVFVFPLIDDKLTKKDRCSPQKGGAAVFHSAVALSMKNQRVPSKPEMVMTLTL